uniref:INB domain-containing protein n=1 Tax=Rhabditophanes sp. KR3021 TaxID=114890 RepID=A0AC35TTJ3_9BILA
MRILHLGALVLLLVASTYSHLDQTIVAKCLGEEGQHSCGECINQDPMCAWCIDPRFPTDKRCGHKDTFKDNECAKTHVYAPSTEIRIAPQSNIPIGGQQRDGVTRIQLEPQQVVLRMQVGKIIEVPFKYQHKKPANGYEVKDFAIQNSDFRSSGVGIEFWIECHGEKIQNKTCPDIKEGETILFYAKITVNECKSQGDLAVSVGVYGYNTVSAIFVTPLCGCECERTQNQDKGSNFCSKRGTLTCGACICEDTKLYGGDRCECELSRYGVSSNEELFGQCKNEDDSVCSNKGKCRCGRCQCNFPDVIKGKFCECDNGSCPKDADGRLCSSRGACECGKCLCENDYEGDDCSCPVNEDLCREDGKICSENGKCQCGKCICNPGFTGSNCGVEGEDQEEEANSSEKMTNPFASSNEEDDVSSQTEGKTSSESHSSESTKLEESTTGSSTSQYYSFLSIAISFLLCILTIFKH